jgi:Flp pilus assembly protein protease CpaA
MQFYYIYVASALIIALGYMLFDVLNNREVPNLFAYATLAFSFAVILLTGNWHLIIQSYLIAFAILGLGYFIYKVGQIGLGDVFEFAALALLLAPITVPIVSHASSLIILPSVISLFVDTGIAAIVVVPLFYIAMAVRRSGTGALGNIRRRDAIRAAIIVAAYLVFAVLLSQITRNAGTLFLVLLPIVAGSTLLILFERPITEVMIEKVGFSEFTEDDIIAFNLMSAEEITAAKRRIKSFDRLVTRRMIDEMRSKKIKTRFPLYKRAIPFAVPIFLGALLTIVFGNILLIAIAG